MEYKTSSHLLRRTLTGPRYDQITKAVELGLDQTVELLLSENQDSLPINYYFEDDPLVPIGETWVGKEITTGISNLNNARYNSLLAWLVKSMLENKFSIKEKMTLFLHNHLVISDNTNSNFNYNYISLLRNNYLGDFKQLVKDVTIEAGMLKYLNGNENTASAPNENYARELLELFTIGKGPLIADGDYTFYTEQDVREIARCLSGWRIDYTNYIGFFKSNQHDKETKQLSDKFDNIVIENLEEEEYKTVIDIIFSKDEVSKFICRQLYIWFVNYNITEDIETNIIEPLAQIFRENNYVLYPVLETLLKSNHFYDECNIGSMVRSPIDYIFTAINAGKVAFPEDEIEKYKVSIFLYKGILKELDQAYFLIPSVAGWKAYYQEPVFYRYWLSSVSLSERKTFIKALINGTTKINGIKYGMDLLTLITEFPEPENPDSLINSFIDLYLSQDLSDEQKEYLKTQVLIPGLPDYEWTVEYSDYLSDPDDDVKKNSILTKLRNLNLILLNMPENQLM
ncbi:MAG: DUF1800 family protein [Saprospiraceae bacterium]